MTTYGKLITALRMLGAVEAADRLVQLLEENAVLRARVVELEDVAATPDSAVLRRWVSMLMVPVEVLRPFFSEKAKRRGLVTRCYHAFEYGYGNGAKYLFQLVHGWESAKNFGPASALALDEALLAYGCGKYHQELARNMRLHSRLVEACERRWVATDPDYPLPMVERLLKPPYCRGETYIFDVQVERLQLRCLGDVVLAYGSGKDEEQRLFNDLTQFLAPAGPSTPEFEEALAALGGLGLHLGMRTELPDYVLEQFARLREKRFGATSAA